MDEVTVTAPMFEVFSVPTPMLIGVIALFVLAVVVLIRRART